MSWAEQLSKVCLEIAQDMKDLRSWSQSRDPAEGSAVTSRLIQHTVKELCLKANQLDPVEFFEIVEGSAAVKLATLNLLQQYRSLGDDVGNFNLALRDLALQIKLFDGAVQKVIEKSQPTSQPGSLKKTQESKTENSIHSESNGSPTSLTTPTTSTTTTARAPNLDDINKIRESIKDTLKKINTMHENKENCSDMIVLLKDQVNAVSEVIGEKNEALIKQVAVIEQLSQESGSSLTSTLRELFVTLRDLEKGFKKSARAGGSKTAAGQTAKNSPSSSHEMNILKEMKEMALLGDPFEVYQVIKKVGEGASGSVYKAAHKDTGKVYALKKIKMEMKNIDNTMKEIKFMGSVKHPNALEFSGFFLQKLECCLVIEFCDAGSVQDILMKTGKGIAENIILAISTQTFKGLEYLHKQNQVHRDIKSGNLLLTSKGEVKIADFGTAAAVDSGLRTTVIGSSFWMAPETIDGRGHDAKVDIWSMGITLIEMAEKDPPNFTLAGNKMAQAILKGPSPSLREASKFSTGFVEIVTQCLEKEPSKRASATHILQHPLLKNTSQHLLVDYVQEIVELDEKNDLDLLQKGEKSFEDKSGRVSKVIPTTKAIPTSKTQITKK